MFCTPLTELIWYGFAGSEVCGPPLCERRKVAVERRPIHLVSSAGVAQALDWRPT